MIAGNLFALETLSGGCISNSQMYFALYCCRSDRKWSSSEEQDYYKETPDVQDWRKGHQVRRSYVHVCRGSLSGINFHGYIYYV